MSAPTCSERWNAYIVFDGNSSSPPWWAMSSGVFSIHGFVAARAADGRPAATSSASDARAGARITRTRVLDAPEALDLDAHDVAAAQEPRRVEVHARRPLGVPVRIRSPGSSVIVSRDEGDDLGDAEDEVARCASPGAARR